MSSTPPHVRDSRPPALPRLGGGPDALDDRVIVFAVEGAPRQACRTHTAPGGRLVFETELEGVVTDVRPDSLHLRVDAYSVVVRHLLPRALDLSELRWRPLHVRIEQRYSGPGRASILAELRDEGGRLLLAAWDGRMPTDGSLFGMSVRAAHEPDGEPRLAIVTERGLVTADLGRPRIVELDGGAFEAIPLRVGPDDLSLLVVRR